MVHRLSEEAEADLDEIWWYIAKESGSTATAQGVTSSLTKRFAGRLPGRISPAL
jgi:plasmid stabilization system protein ParE